MSTILLKHLKISSFVTDDEHEELMRDMVCFVEDCPSDAGFVTPTEK